MTIMTLLRDKMMTLFRKISMVDNFAKLTFLELRSSILSLQPLKILPSEYGHLNIIRNVRNQLLKNSVFSVISSFFENRKFAFFRIFKPIFEHNKSIFGSSRAHKMQNPSSNVDLCDCFRFYDSLQPQI